MLLACLHSAQQHAGGGARGGGFAVNVLAEDQAALAALFARPSDGTDKFDGVPVREGRTGVPVLGGTLATIECRVQERGARWHAPGVPLAGSSTPRRRRDLRSRISAAPWANSTCARTPRPTPRCAGWCSPAPSGRARSLDVQALAEQLRTSASAVFYALDPPGRREPRSCATPSEGTSSRPLVAADSGRRARRQAGHRVGRRGADRRPARRRTSSTEFAGPGRGDGSPHIVDGRLADVEPFIAANAEFHALSRSGPAASMRCFRPTTDSACRT